MIGFYSVTHQGWLMSKMGNASQCPYPPGTLVWEEFQLGVRRQVAGGSWDGEKSRESRRAKRRQAA